MKIGLAILNRNEETALPEVLPKITQHGCDFIFCVDGESTDNSLKIIRDHGIEVISQPSLGRGAAFRAAFAHAPDADAIIFFSPDGNEDPADIREFRKYLELGADIVIGSRMMAGGVDEADHQWIKARKWGNLFFDWLAFVTWG